MHAITKKEVPISVVGIAGPGDPFANPDEVLETIRLVQKDFPDMLYCLSTNGLGIAPYIDELSKINVSHVTITINAIDPDIAAQMYGWVRYNKKVYRGIEAGKLMIEKQFEAIKLLKAKGITVKINTIIVPGINDEHAVEVAECVAAMGADIMNCIPLKPTEDTAFESIEEPEPSLIHKIRKQISTFIKPMEHCQRCRADAAGLLGRDIPEAFDLIKQSAAKPLNVTEKRPYVAVASHEGILVNQHLGEAKQFLIYGLGSEGYDLIEKRIAPPQGLGDQRWIEMAKTLADCNTVLVNGAGQNPTIMLKSMGVKIVQLSGLIDDALDCIYKGRPLNGMAVCKPFKCGDSCNGSGGGCG
jgi:nitrogen fixation protein NifB